MQDRQLYQQILGIMSPWSVARVELALEQGEVRVFLEHATEVEWCCAECGRVCPLHDHEPPRGWRHLDTCQYRTVLYASIPRTKCPEHGVKVIQVPWAEPHGRFTALFERLVIDWLLAASQQAVAERMGLSWDEVHGIMERAVRRGLARRTAEVIPHVGVDEKAFRKGHRYVTIVTDLNRGRVLHVAKDRKRTSLDGFWKTLTGPSARGSKPWRWICTTRTWRRYGTTCRRRTRRSCMTSSMWRSIWEKRWTRCGGWRTKRCGRTGTIGWSEPGTPGCATRRTLRRSSREQTPRPPRGDV